MRCPSSALNQGHDTRSCIRDLVLHRKKNLFSHGQKSLKGQCRTVVASSVCWSIGPPQIQSILLASNALTGGNKRINQSNVIVKVGRHLCGHIQSHHIRRTSMRKPDSTAKVETSDHNVRYTRVLTLSSTNDVVRC